MIRKLVNMILHCRVLKISDDTENYPSVQISYYGKVADATRLMPYPLVGNATLTSLGLKLNVGADEGNRVVILHDPTQRVRGLLEGEGGIANSITGDYVLLKNTGIEILANSDMTVDIAGNLNISVTRATIDGEVAIEDAFGCNGAAPQASAPLGAVATDLGSVIALANAMRTALVADGIGS